MTETRRTILDAAAKLLSDAGAPMRCGDIADGIIARGLWATEGKTPECSLRAALQRDRRRGDASRFIVAEGGMVGVRPPPEAGPNPAGHGGAGAIVT